MVKSIFDERFAAGDAIIRDIRDQQLERLRRVDDLWESTLADWEDLAKAEDSVRREYRGRYLFELLQNAHDAIIDGFLKHDTSEGFPGWNHVSFELTSDSLLIANSGMPFQKDNIRSICRLHHTTKSAAKQIGHKGIGFKSVLEITEAPEVYSDCYAFGFNRHQFASDVSETVGDFSIDETSLPVLRAPYIRRLSWLAPEERGRIEDLLKQGYVTVIRLPLQSDALVERVAQRMQEELRPEILIFLDYLDKLIVRYPSGRRIEYSKETRRKNTDGSREILLWSEEAEELSIESRWLTLPTKEISIDNRKLVEGLGEAWQQVDKVRCGVAFPLTSERELAIIDDPQVFHVYFPTEESCGLRFLVNADFYIEAARKDIRRNLLNDHLAAELALHIAINGTDTLKDWFPHDPAIVEMLAPIQHPNRQFGALFNEEYLAALSETAFVPLSGGQYKSPSEIRLTPQGADASEFRKFFPPSRIRGASNWAYSKLEVEERELARKENGNSFLLLDEMGAEQLDISDILSYLHDGPPISRGRRGRFFRFLANWWDELPRHDRKPLIEVLSQCAIVPTQSGWGNPSDPDTLIFQANLREEQDVEIPKGFAFKLVSLDAYGEERSHRGVQAQFLTQLGVSPYQARDILRRAILPVLTSPERFHDLIGQYPDAIYRAYIFLREYRQRELSIREVKEDLSHVPVPAYRVQNPSEQIWKSANRVYFSEYWTGNDDLDTLYGVFENSFFLGPIDGLSIDSNAEKQEWYQFFAWLGVANAPRLLEEDGKRDQYFYSRSRSDHPFHERPLWKEYLNEYRRAFRCTNPRKHHGRTRWMGTNWALDRFEEIVEQAQSNIELSIRLFRLLGHHWKKFQGYLSTRLTCRHTSTGCESGQMPSYLAYCLRQSAWVPAIRLEQISKRLFRPGDVWNLGVDVRPEVRDMLPSLPDQFQGEEYRGIRVDLLKTEFDFEDYIGTLQRLPELCPLRPSGLTDQAIKNWQDATRAVFNWLGQAIQNSLVRQGREHWPQPPKDLPLLTYKGEEPHYVWVNMLEIVYPDDPLLADKWEDDLFYLKIDRSWQTFREWLGVPKLSDRISRDLQPSRDLEDPTRNVRRQFKKVLPYFLAIVSEQQNSRLDQVLARMRRLDIHVVEELIMEQTLADSEISPKLLEEKLYLMERDVPNPRGGRLVRAGDLYITRDELDNPYIVGDPIAAYIEIEGLSDAFIMLYGQKDPEERMRYLESRGVSEEQVQEAAQQLQMPLEKGVFSRKHDALRTAFMKHGASSIALSEQSDSDMSPARGDPGLLSQPFEPALDSEGDTEEAGSDTPSEPEQELRELPSLDMSGELRTITFEKSEMPPQSTEDIAEPGRQSGGGGGWARRMLSEEERERLGKRGEEWAYDHERRRLAILGLDPTVLEQEGKLAWVAKKQKYAPYDIRSLDKVDGRLEEIYIEVKSTTGQDRTVQWSIREFEMANSVGDRYWLYWIGHVDRERPDPPVRYQNPVQLWEEGYIRLDFRQLEITLPEELE